jgi:hypothetical protein
MSLPCTASTETEVFNKDNSANRRGEGRKPENVASQASTLELTRPALIAFSNMSWSGSPSPARASSRTVELLQYPAQAAARNEPAQTREGFQWFA